MVGGSHIVSIGAGGDEPRRDSDELVLTEEIGTDAESHWETLPAPPSRLRFPSIFSALTIILVAGWTAFFGWTYRSALLGGTLVPAEAIALIRDWSLPVLLVCTVWLLTMRNSNREAARFGDAARRLGEESAQLEARLTAVNRELSLAREFIAAQSRDIEALGRITVERISEHAERLSGLIRDNSARVETIGSVSVTALDNLEKLRGQLPVIASSAKDVTNNIANAGRAAHAQLEDMISGFARLNEFGQASERQVDTVKARVEAAMGEFARLTERIEGFAAERFAALAQRGEEFRLELDRHEVEALAAVRSRADALAEELTQTRGVLDRHEEDSLTSLRARLSAVRDEGAAIARAMRDGEAHALDAWRTLTGRLRSELDTAIDEVDASDARAQDALHARMNALMAEIEQADTRLSEHGRLQSAALESRRVEAEQWLEAMAASLDRQLEELDDRIATRRAAHEEQVRRLEQSVEASADRLGMLAETIRDIAGHGRETEQGLGTALDALAARLHTSREALTGTDAAVGALTDASVRLLELIQASAQHTADNLPAAIGAGETRLLDFERRADALIARIAQAQEGGTLLARQIETAHAGLSTTLGDLDRLHQTLFEHDQRHHAAIAELHAALNETGESSAALADRAGTTLREAIEQLRSAAQGAVTELETASGTAVAALASRLGEQSREAIEQMLRDQGEEAVHKLAAAAARATAASTDAAEQLRDQIAAVDELAASLEQRIGQARELALSQVDNDFSRRAALITEALNSSAIDIAKALDSDVADTAWSSYLRGDRGVFTRRAIRLLDAGEARAVIQLYQNDHAFRDHVAQYIHDFEAMLRELLSTRDGHRLSVTLLSSDMGKLYVALAQAIERLRG